MLGWDPSDLKYQHMGQPFVWYKQSKPVASRVWHIGILAYLRTFGYLGTFVGKSAVGLRGGGVSQTLCPTLDCFLCTQSTDENQHEPWLDCMASSLGIWREGFEMLAWRRQESARDKCPTSFGCIVSSTKGVSNVPDESLSASYVFMWIFFMVKSSQEIFESECFALCTWRRDYATLCESEASRSKLTSCTLREGGNSIFWLCVFLSDWIWFQITILMFKQPVNSYIKTFMGTSGNI